MLGFFAYGALQGGEVAGKDVLEVGSLDVNGSVRPFVMARGPASYVGVDVVDGPGVDRVLDAVDLAATFGPDSFDVVISTEMLEHAEDWQAAIANMVAVLRPGGVLVWTTRSPGFAYHHPPDRWRYTQQAMAEILQRLLLEPLVVMDDPEYPGVFCKARMPKPWYGRELVDHALHTDLLADVPGVTPMPNPVRKWLGMPAEPDGCGYYRFWQPWTQLARWSGHQVAIPDPGEHRILPDDEIVEEFDLLARQRPAGELGTRRWRRWGELTRTVYEVDDNLLEPDPSGAPHLLDPETREQIKACLRASHLVTTSTETLAEVYRPYNDRIVVVPNFIHEDLLALERPRRERVTLCWAGGANHLQDLELVRDPVKGLLDADPQVDWHMLGFDYRPIFGDRGRFTGWQPNVWSYYAAIDGDIGVVPLRDTPFNRARTPIKALEYAALGIPVVASDLEPYREFVIDGVTGYLVRTPDQWRARLTELVNDEAARIEMGAKAKEVARGHTIQQGWTRWRDIYEEVCAG